MNEKYRYARGSENNSESVEFDVRDYNGNHITTCVIDVGQFLQGKMIYSCGDGSNFRLNDDRRYEISEVIKKGRGTA